MVRVDSTHTTLSGRIEPSVIHVVGYETATSLSGPWTYTPQTVDKNVPETFDPTILAGHYFRYRYQYAGAYYYTTAAGPY
jgi:hypothetical protein